MVMGSGRRKLEPATIGPKTIKSWKSTVFASFFIGQSWKKLKKLSFTKLCQTRIVKKVEKVSFYKFFWSVARGASGRLRKSPCPPPQKTSLQTTNLRECGSRTVQAVLWWWPLKFGKNVGAIFMSGIIFLDFLDIVGFSSSHDSPTPRKWVTTYGRWWSFWAFHRNSRVFA